MRDLIVVLTFAALLPFALRRAWIAVMVWTWLSLMNPHKLGWGFANDLPLAAIAAATAFVSMLFNVRDVRLPSESSVRALVVFLAWCCLTTLFSVAPNDSATQLWKVTKIQLMTFVALMVVRERRHIEWFVWVNVLSIGFFGLKGGVFTLLSGGENRVWGPPDSFIEGNNEIGLALVITIPLINYLRLVQPRRWVRHALWALMLLCAGAALGTHSRGALVAMVAMLAMLWWRSRSRVLGGIALLILAIGFVAFMPDEWLGRMETIRDYQTDKSAMGRINAWITAINIANDRFFGAGFAMYQPAIWDRYAPAPEERLAAHSIFFQVLGEHGWIGLGLFTAIGWLAWREASRIRRRTAAIEPAQWLHTLVGMVQVSMVGYAVGGSFLSLAYFDLPYNLIVIVVAARAWLDEERWRSESDGVFGAINPDSVGAAGMRDGAFGVARAAQR